MSTKDYLPRAFATLLAWLLNLKTYLSDSAVTTRLNIDPEKLTPVWEQIDDYQAAYDRAEQPNAGKADRHDRMKKAEIVSATIRHFVKTLLRYNDAVTDDDRIRLGLTIPDTTLTPEGDIKEYPEIEADTSVIRRVKCRFLNREHHASKPPHVHGTELRSGIIHEGETPSLRHLIESSFSTRSSLTLDFSARKTTRPLCPLRK